MSFDYYSESWLRVSILNLNSELFYRITRTPVWGGCVMTAASICGQWCARWSRPLPQLIIPTIIPWSSIQPALLSRVLCNLIPHYPATPDPLKHFPQDLQILRKIDEATKQFVPDATHTKGQVPDTDSRCVEMWVSASRQLTLVVLALTDFLPV